MKFYSTNGQSPLVTLKEAVLTGLASDGGLYIPTKIPALPGKFYKKIHKLSFQEISFEVAKVLFRKDIPEKVLQNIIDDAFNFPVPLLRLAEDLFVFELFHGPTLAFKDFAARFMARMLSYFIQGMNKDLTILVATSGDTGSAVANGFFNLKGFKVVILYPSKKVSNIQESQLTTIGGNVTALEIKGSFDDCQKLVKQAFIDNDLKNNLNLTSSNSINIARLFPQTFYYFYAFAQIGKTDKPVIISVPSGNFGNITGGLIAKRMGLPIDRFIASTNINDTVPRYFLNGKYNPRPSKETISNAMDVGDPSNFSRILALYDFDLRKMEDDISSYRFSDERTKAAICKVYKENNYIMDPHGAVAYLGLQKYLKTQSQLKYGIFIETAHPAKFSDTIKSTLNIDVEIPDRLKTAMNKPKKSLLMANSFSELKEFLLNKSFDKLRI
jgi:threonine synthase